MNRIIAIILWMMMVATSLPLSAQPNAELINSYPFIRDTLNYLVNDSALIPFYNKLDELRNGKRDKLVVVHIGDSHIQADYFSGTMRQLLHLQFGNGGRGLVFPYRVAKTNEPKNFETGSNVLWEAKRNVFPKLALPIGVCGITIRTFDSAAFIDFNIHNSDSIDYSFNRLKIFHYKGPDAFDFIIKDTTGSSLAFINSKITTPDFFSTDIRMPQPVHGFRMQCLKSDSMQKQAMVYGVELQNQLPGIVYDMIGVNGAMFAHYDSSQYFFDQLISLHPDLVIVSLGTNEAYTKYFTENEFSENLQTFVSQLKSATPGAGILLTSPPDGYRYRKYKNANVSKIVKVLNDYCLSNQATFWDFYHLMGGYGSIYKWYKNGLAQKDLLHLTRKGYELQGHLLFNALIDSYHHFSLHSRHD